MKKESKTYELNVKFPDDSEVDLLDITHPEDIQETGIYVKIDNHRKASIEGVKGTFFRLKLQWPLADLSKNFAELSSPFNGLLIGCDDAVQSAVDEWEKLPKKQWLGKGFDLDRQREFNLGKTIATSIDPLAIIDFSKKLYEFTYKWPQVDDYKIISRASCLPGGILSKQDTLRGFSKRPELMKFGEPAWTSRRIHNLHAFQCKKLADEIKSVENLIKHNKELRSQHRELDKLMDNLSSAIAKLLPNRLVQDPNEATWPTSAKRLLRSIKSLFIKETNDGLPFAANQILFEEDAYEIWCAIALKKSLEGLLGETKTRDTFYSIQIDRWEIKLACKHPFFDNANSTNAFLKEFKSVTSKLIPDYTLSIKNIQSTENFVFLLDAKLWRTDRNTTGKFLAEATKYLWGIRRNDQQNIHDKSFVDSVTLINTKEGLKGLLNDSERDVPYDTRSSRIHILPATPGAQGDKAIEDHIRMLLEQAGVLMPTG